MLMRFFPWDFRTEKRVKRISPSEAQRQGVLKRPCASPSLGQAEAMSKRRRSVSGSIWRVTEPQKGSLGIYLLVRFLELSQDLDYFVILVCKKSHSAVASFVGFCRFCIISQYVYFYQISLLPLLVISFQVNVTKRDPYGLWCGFLGFLLTLPLRITQCLEARVPDNCVLTASYKLTRVIRVKRPVQCLMHIR